MSKNPQLFTPNLEQLKALEEFAKLHGRTWKSNLRSAWETGNYQRCSRQLEVTALLQQCRNQGGPFWLNSFRLRVSLESNDQDRAARTPGTQQWAETYSDNLGESPDY